MVKLKMLIIKTPVVKKTKVSISHKVLRLTAVKTVETPKVPAKNAIGISGAVKRIKVPKAPAKRITSGAVKAALRLKYAAPQYAILEEVRNATGRLKKRHGKQPRYADMIAMGLWPSIGLELMGFEVKVSRADWLAEIGDDKKAVAVQQFCDRWYLVTHSDKIVKDGELPDNWGWLVVEGTLVREMVPAKKLEAQPVTREFLASLLRNAATSNPDYIELQSRIIEERMAQMPQPKSRSAVKVVRRQTMNSLAAEVKRLKRVIEDMKVGG